MKVRDDVGILWYMYSLQGQTTVMAGPWGWNNNPYGFVVQKKEFSSSSKIWHLKSARGDSAPALAVNWLGCWEAENNHTMGPAVATKNETWGGAADAVRRCARLAVSKRKALFALQAGNECRLGDDENAPKRLRQASGDCNSVDGEGFNLGAGLRNALYRVPDRARFLTQASSSCPGGRGLWF